MFQFAVLELVPALYGHLTPCIVAARSPLARDNILIVKQIIFIYYVYLVSV